MAKKEEETIAKTVDEMLYRGASASEIAKELGISIGPAMKLIRESKKKNGNAPEPFHLRHKSRITAWINEGKTTRQIAYRLNTTNKKAKEAILALGLEENEERTDPEIKTYVNKDIKKQHSKTQEERAKLEAAREEEAERKKKKYSAFYNGYGSKDLVDPDYLAILAKKGFNDREIAEKIGKGLNMTRTILDQCGIEYEKWVDRRFRLFEFPLSAEELEDALYEGTIGDIAEELGLSYGHVRRAVQEYGLSEIASMRIRTIIPEDAMRKYVNEGMTMRQLCEKFGCGYSIIKYNLDEYGLTAAKYERPPALDADTCQAYADAGMTMSDIARETGISYWAVRNSYQKADIEPAQRIRAYEQLIETSADDIRELAAEGESMRSIAEMLDTSYESVRRAFAELGLESSAAGRKRVEVDEEEIARLISEGLAMQKIADALDVSREVVMNRVKNDEILETLYESKSDLRREITAEAKRVTLSAITDKEDIEKIREMAAGGMTQTAIAAELDVSLSALRTALHRFDIETHAVRGFDKHDISPEQLRYFLSLGMRPEYIANDLGVSRGIVYSRMREQGLSAIVRVRDDARAAYIGKMLSVDKLARAYGTENKSVDEIAEDAGTTRESVYTAIRMHGISRKCGTADADIVSVMEAEQPSGGDNYREEQQTFVRGQVLDDELKDKLTEIMRNGDAGKAAETLDCRICDVYESCAAWNLYEKYCAEIAAGGADKMDRGNGRHRVSLAAGVLTRENLENWIAENMSVAGIAEETGISRYTVYDYLRKYGLKVNKASRVSAVKNTGGKNGKYKKNREHAGSYRDIAENRGEELKVLVASGLSVKDIADKMGSTRSKIRMAMNELGVSVSGRSGKLVRPGSYKDIVENREQELRDLVASGKSVRAIAEEMDSTREKIRMAMETLGLKSKSSIAQGRHAGLATYKELAETHGEEIRNLVAAGKSARAIAEEMGSTRERVKQAMGLLGLKTQGAYRHGKNANENIDRKTVQDMLLGGIGVREVAEKLGTTKNAIYWRLRNWGIGSDGKPKDYSEKAKQA